MVPLSNFNDIEWPLTQISRSDIFWSWISQGQSYHSALIIQNITLPNISNGTTCDDLEWPLNASRAVCQHQLNFLFSQEGDTWQSRKSSKTSDWCMTTGPEEVNCDAHFIVVTRQSLFAYRAASTLHQLRIVRLWLVLQAGDGKRECAAGQDCQCPCYTATDYNYCSGHFAITESVSLFTSSPWLDVQSEAAVSIPIYSKV